MAEVEILNIDGIAYITKESADKLYKPKNNGEANAKSINYVPAQEQKIQFSLTEPYTIFYCTLDLASVQNITNTINTVTDGTKLTLGIQSSLQGNDSLTTALNAIKSKGWTVGTYYN